MRVVSVLYDRSKFWVDDERALDVKEMRAREKAGVDREGIVQRGGGFVVRR